LLARSIDLQWDEYDEEPESERLVDIEKEPRDGQASEEVDRAANSRIKAESNDGLSLRADGEGAT
jgi:hypothetical protein